MCIAGFREPSLHSVAPVCDCSGGEDSNFDPKALHSALTKLFKLLPEKIQESEESQQFVGKNKPPASLDSSTEDMFVMRLSTSHLYLWIDEHRGILQKLLAGGQAHALSPVPSNA